MKLVQKITLICLVFLPLLGCKTTLTPPLLQAPPETTGRVISRKPFSPLVKTYPNGLKLVFLEDKEVPLVKSILYMRGGNYWEKATENGVVSAMGHLLRNGGAGPYSSEKLDFILESLPASIASDFGQEFGKVSFSCMKDDTGKVFSIFSQIVLSPRFEEKSLKFWKSQSIEGIRRRIDDPDTIGNISFNQLIYGDSPYGQVTIEKDIEKISVVDLRESYEYLVRPDEAVLAVVGNIAWEKLQTLVESKLGPWKPRGQVLPPFPPLEHGASPGVYFIKRPVVQSSIYIGHLGVTRHTPDEVDIGVFNNVFGSGFFGSRLFQKVRTELGLAYGVYGGIYAAAIPGKNAIILKTKSEATVDSIEASLRELKALQDKEAAQEDVDEQIQSIMESFVFNFESPSEVVKRKVSLGLLGYPPDFDDIYLDKVSKVNSQDVMAVAQRHWDMSKFVVLIVGNEDALKLAKKMVNDTKSYLFGFPLKEVFFDQKLLG